VRALKEIIADNIKWYRSEKGWSLSVAAQKTGVSKAMLGQLERQESSPTMATMWKLAKGFELPLSVLIEQRNPIKQQRSVQHENLDDAFEYRTLFAFDPVLACEMFSLRLAPGKISMSTAHATGVVEDIVVLNGELDVLIDDQWQRLAAGDALRFNADQTHGYKNPAIEDAVFHNIIHYPKGH
jgi:transcriptional regulator with XRE-family HTH domain